VKIEFSDSAMLSLIDDLNRKRGYIVQLRWYDAPLREPIATSDVIVDHAELIDGSVNLFYRLWRDDDTRPNNALVSLDLLDRDMSTVEIYVY
jgi:hypothetical protein